MNEEAFFRFLRRGGRTEDVSRKTIQGVRRAEAHLEARGRKLDESEPGDIDELVAWAEGEGKMPVKGLLQALTYYFKSTGREDLARAAGRLRRARIDENRQAFRLRDFTGVDAGSVGRLEAIGIKTVDHMLAAGRTKADRVSLAARTGLPEPSSGNWRASRTWPACQGSRPSEPGFTTTRGFGAWLSWPSGSRRLSVGW